MIRPALTAVLAAGLLAACTTTSVPTPIVVPDTPIALPLVQPLTLNPVRWQVLPPGKGRPAPLFALDETNYTNFTLNLVEIKRFLSEQKAVITMLTAVNQQRAQRGVPNTPTATTGPANP